VWIIGEVLDSDASDDIYNSRDGVIDVGKVKPLNHIWGDIFTTTMTETRFKRAAS
jgi:hypothetical protein